MTSLPGPQLVSLLSQGIHRQGPPLPPGGVPPVLPPVPPQPVLPPPEGGPGGSSLTGAPGGHCAPGLLPGHGLPQPPHGLPLHWPVFPQVQAAGCQRSGAGPPPPAGCLPAAAQRGSASPPSLGGGAVLPPASQSWKPTLSQEEPGGSFVFLYIITVQ